MKRLLALVVIGIVGAAFVACQPGATGLSEQDQAAIRKVVDDAAKISTAPKADYAAYVKLYYTEDATVLVANMPPVTGHSALQAMFETFPPLSDFKPEIVDLDGRGDLAYVRGNYTMTMTPPGAPAVTDKGKYVEVWKKQADGTWKVSYDSWSSDLPMPGLMVAAGSLKADASAELKQLDMLAGAWKIDGEYKAAKDRPATKTSMTFNCSWFDGGKHVVCQYEGMTSEGPSHRVDFYGYDPAAKAYTLLYVESAGMVGSGKLAIDKATWTHVWDVKGGPQPMKQRLTLTDMTQTSGNWKNEFSTAGGPWTVVAEGTYARTK